MSRQLKKQPLAPNTSKLNSILSTSGYKKSNKSLLSLGTSLTSDLVQLSQSEVNFINTQQNQVYQISFMIRNISQKSIKIKLKKPKSDFFTAVIEKDGILAPGLEKKIIVTYNSQLNDQIHDKLSLYCQDQFEIQVPVCVFPTVYNLEYQPFINLGFVKLGVYQYHVKIGNKRNVSAQIRLQPQFKGAKAVIQPMILTIPPKGNEQAILYLNSEQVSQFEGIIQIHPQILGQQVIEVVGSFCQHTRFISDRNGKQISQLAINPMFGGQKLTTTFNLINNTPKSCEFRIIRKKGFSNNDDQSILITPQQFGRQDEEKNIIFSSIQGELQPYSKKQITCDIVAKIQEHDQQVFCNYLSGRIKLLPYQSKQWGYMISTTFKDEDSAKNLIIKGESIIPKLSINSIFFKFCDCPLRVKQEKILKIQNLSDRSVPVFIQKSQNYSCVPDTFQIPKDGSKEVIVRFFPKVVGDLHQICHIKVAAFSFPLKMFGKGIFVNESHKKTLLNKDINYSIDQSRGVQINVSEMDKTLIEHQISIINQKSIFIQQNSKITTTNFDCSTLGGASIQKGKIQNKNSIRKKPLKNKNGKQIIIDIQNFNPDQEVEQYPGLGRSLQEDRVVSRELTLNQFKNIPVGPIVIDFGEMFVSSAQTKTFHICNLNSKPISIQIQTKNKFQFQKSSKQAQILPAQSHGGLKIVYQSTNQGSFKHSLQYIINGRHYFEILAIGNAILPTIQPSKTQFKFVAGEDDHTFQKRQTFTLNNTYPFQVQYNFVSQKQSLFKVTPTKGRIQPRGKQNICIVHNFLGILEGGGKIEQTLKLKIKNGKTIQLKCLSIVPQCYVICKPNQCNFKEISVYKQHQMKFSIKNTSKNFTIFKIVPNKDIQEEVKITASKSILGADQFAEVTVKLMSQVEKTIDSGVTIIVRGGKKIFISIKATIIVPKIRIQGEQINFGSLPVGGNPTSKQITLINQSLIPAEIDLVLFNDTFLQRCLSIKCDSNELRTVNPPKDIKQIKAKVYQVKIAKKCKTQIWLQFSPEQVKDYKFTLPFYLTGSSQPFPSLQKNAICRSLKNRLVVDHKQLDFGKTIIEQSFDNVSKNVVFTLTNPQDQQIQWWASEKNIEPFSLQVKKGKIQGNSSIKIKAFFYSENPGVFQKQLHFFLNNSDFQPSRPYIKLPIRATANYPQIYFDRPYVILPSVKLGQESTGKFQIINGGYENLSLKHSINQQYSSIDLNIKYVNGCNLGVTKKSIIVLVSFKSEKPISFTVKIDFYDHHNRVFSIFVSGTSDNSLYFLPDSYWLSDPQQQLTNSANFLTNFLNSLGFVEDILYDFPNCLSNNDYQNLNKLIQYFSTQNQRVDKYKSLPSSNIKKANTLQQNYDYLSELMKNLKSEGAFLSEIRPQFLMSQTECIQLLKIKSQNTRIFSNYKLPTSQQFRQKRLTSWIILIYQIFRVYSRVNSKKKLPVGDFWSHLLQKQKTIINWLQQCYQSEANLQQIKSSNQLSDLGDGEMLSALVTKYTNIRILQSYGKVCNNYKDKQRRCKKIIEIFSQIGITSGARTQDLLRSKPVQMLVFLQRLYLILPYYLQKGETIVFSCAIGQSLTKSIQIKNPSKYPVTYIAKIQGSKAYVIQNQQQFQIQSRQKHQIQVRYISNIDIDKNNGTLTLSGRTSSKFTPSTFIFVLKSVSLGRISEKNIQITGQLYQPYQFQINVKNNFGSDTAFNVEIICTNQKIQTKNLYCTSPIIKIKKDQIMPVSFLFFPFILQTHKYQILFRDPKVGQFQYDLTALVDMPQIMPDPIRLTQTFFTNKPYPVQIIIPQKNQQIIKARKQYDAFLQKIQRKANSQLNSLSKKTSLVQTQKNYYPILKQQVYTLSLIPQTQMVTLKNTMITLDPQQDQTSSQLKKLFLDINMKMPVKDAPIYLVMKNTSSNDIRRYKILINSVYKPLRYQLQMKIPVNQSLTQPLPLINISNQTNIFNVSLTTNCINNVTQAVAINRNVFSFTNQKDIMVRARQQSTVNLTFTPKAQMRYFGLIKIQNMTVGQIVQYEINALGEEPITQVLKFQQKTGQQKKYTIKIPFTKPQKLTVIKCTFNQQNIKYDKSTWCSCQSLSVFKFQYYTRIPGVYEGKLFLEDQNKIHAFLITILVNQNIEGIIEIKAIQREKHESSINLAKGFWSVEHTDPNLIIQPEFQLQENGPFVFGYVGSKAGYSQSELVVKSQKIGYFKYLLKVTIQEQPERQIKDLRCQLGKTYTTVIKLQNPDNNSIAITGTCTNIDTFYYQPEGNFTIPAKGKKEITFIYRPTCLDLQIGKISFVSNSNLKWKYELSGCGILQAEDQIKQIDGEVGTDIIETINFINPLKKDVYIYMMLQSQNDNQVKFATKNQKQALKYLQQLEIPIKFSLTQAKKYTCRLKILINQKIFWKYVINVRTICRSQDETKIYKLPCRGKKQLTASFVLPNLTKQIYKTDKFKCLMTAENQSMQQLLKSTCRVVKDWQTINEGKISFLFHFLSYRPFICPFYFEIYQENNCKWLFKGQVEYTMPPPDDQFEIISEINKPTSVMFRLNNRVKSHAKFKAYFTSDSDMEFNISPKSGDLQPYGREGSQFQVTFAPTQYRNSWHGKIIIETDDSFWSYIVKGNLPHYIPPVGKSSLGASTISRRVQQ